MKIENISAAANKLIKQYKSRNPYELADYMGVTVMLRDDFTKLKGMYTIIARKRFIFINSNLHPHMQRTVCAHELGHDQLHRELASERCFQEFVLYDMSLRPEYEANVFASELLLPDDEILDLIGLEYDNIQIAQTMNSDPNLVGIKASLLLNRGYNFRIPGYRSDFLKD